jgi:peptide/nickel transport system substrate-binding protein
MSRSRWAVAAALAVALAAGGCSSGGSSSDAASDTPVSGGTLTWAVQAQPGAGGLDPMVSANSAALGVLEQIYETLLVKDDEGAIKPGLAESYEQVDPVTYRFTLRDGVEFSDGSPLTPDDVVFTFQTYLAGTSAAKAFLANLQTVEAVDDRTVQFTFSQPNGTFLNAVANRSSFFIVNKAWYGAKTSDQRQREAMGTGPFVLGTWTDNVELTLEKNPGYWEAPKPYLDEIVFKIVPDETSRLSLVQQGSVQAAWFSDALVAEQAKDAGFTEGDLSYTGKLSVFINPASGPLSDKRVRQALSLSLDREQLIELGLNGYGQTSLFTVVGDPSSPKPDEDTPYYARDVKKAKALLAEAGMSDVTISLSYPSDLSQQNIPVYEVMKQQAADAGITLNLVATPWAEISKTYTYGDPFTDMVSFGNIFNADYTGYFNQYLSDTGLMNHWKATPDADKARDLLKQLTVETDQDKRHELAVQLNDEVAENVLNIVPLATPQVVEVWDANQLHGYSSDPYSFRYRLKDAWLSE